MITTDITSIFYGLILALVAFFLSQFYLLVKRMSDDIKNILISNARFEERVKVLEEEVEEIRSDIKQIKHNTK